MLFRRHREAADSATRGMLLGFAAALLLLVVAVNAALALALRLTLPFVDGTPALFYQTNTAIVLLFVLGGSWIETLRLREGGSHVARLAGARPADPASRLRDGRLERRLVNVVQEIAVAARVPPPAAWVLARDPNINAFAAGWTADDAVITVTQGALERLTRAELQGLVGHEIGHIVRGDMQLNTRLVGLVWGLQMVHGLGRALAARDEQGRLHAGALIGVALVVVGWLGWLAGRMLQAGVSRQREFAADASAVQYARTVDGIGGVLRKIAGLPPMPRPRPPASLAHLWVAELSAAGAFGWRRWLATHPPLALRLQRLYGRKVEALDAPLLPLPSEDEPVLALAPARAAAPVLEYPRPALATGRASVAAPRDALPVAGESADLQDERDTRQRASHWRSPGECRAALLAWLIGDGADAARWSAWQRLAGDAAYVKRLRADWLTLGALARWEIFDALVARTRGGPAADRAALLRDARGLATSGTSRLRLLLLRRALRVAPARRGRMALEDLTPAFDAATGLLALSIGAAGADWQAAVGQAHGGATSQVRARDALALRRLHPMQGPRVARAWGAAADRVSVAHRATAIDCVRVACRLLDTPAPQSDQLRIL